jgi:peptide/nickel transport system substrate-binding protein
MSRSVRKKPALVALATAAALLLGGCAASASADSAASSPTVLKWGFSLPTSWDPVTSSTGNDINTISLAYASLTELNQKGTAEPALAESWKYNANGTAVTFALRPKLRFSDGTTLDAAAVKASLLRGQTQANSLLKDQLATIKSIDVVDATHVRLNLVRADYQVPNLLAGKTGEIVNPAAFKTAKGAAGIPTNSAGAGPFKFKSFVPESNAVLVKNPYYWDAKDVHIDELDLSVAPDPSTVIAAVQSGALDVASLPATDVKAAKAAGLKVDIVNSLSVSQFDVNSGLAPLTNAKVVDALKYAIDRAQLLKVANAGIGTVTYQPFPKGYVAYDPSLANKYAYDPAKAKSLLAAAGYQPGQLSIAITTSAYSQSAAELVQAQLKAIGVIATIKLIPVGSSTWQQAVYIGRTAQFALDGTVGRESPVQNLGVVYGPTGLMNTSRTSSPAFLAALDAVRKTPLDAPDYASVLQNAVKLGVLQASSFSLYSTPRIDVRSPKVSALPHYLSQFRWEGVTVSGK